MRSDIQQALKGIHNLKNAEERLCDFLASLRKKDSKLRIGFVCGMISSEGREYIDENMARLQTYVQTISSRVKYPIFSSADVFTPEVYTAVNLADRTNEEFIQFWRGIFKSKTVTDVYFTPRWIKSDGARDEFETALQEGVNVHIFIGPPGNFTLYSLKRNNH